MFKFADPADGQLFSKVPFTIYWGTSALLSVIVGFAMWYFGPYDGQKRKPWRFSSLFKKETWEINTLT
jgi:hypothetical protein